MLYFAYGDNMDEATLAARGVEFTKVCTGKVRQLRLAFQKPGADGTGRADLKDDQGGVTEGVVYDVPEAALANLDVYEGVDNVITSYSIHYTKLYEDRRWERPPWGSRGGRSRPSRRHRRRAGGWW